MNGSRPRLPSLPVFVALLAVVLGGVLWLDAGGSAVADVGAAGFVLASAAAVAVPAGGQKRKLIDEQAKVHADLLALRSAEPKDAEEAADFEKRCDDLAKRADEIAASLEKENRYQAVIARGVKAVGDSGDPLGFRGVHSGSEKPKRSTRFGKPHGFESDEQAESVGAMLRDIARGKLPEVRYDGHAKPQPEQRAGWGETVPTFNNAGAEYGPVVDLYTSVVNKLNYSSKVLQLAFVTNTTSNKVTVPKPGAVTWDFTNENAAATEQTPTTTSATVDVYDAKGEVAISNNLMDDSPIDVASEFSDFAVLGCQKFIDSVWLSGHVGKSIGGLYAGIGAGRKVTVPVGTKITQAQVGEVMGTLDPLLPDDGMSWVVSAAGWGQLAAAGTLLPPILGTDRPRPTIWGSPAYKVAALPANVLAIYGHFGFTTCVAMRKQCTITPLREIRRREGLTVMLFEMRIGLVNHAPEYAGALVQGT